MPCMLVEKVLHKYAAVATTFDSRSWAGGVTTNIVSEHKWINYMAYRIRHECRWVDTRDIGTMAYTDRDII